jgi:hypothetical protein
MEEGLPGWTKTGPEKEKNETRGETIRKLMKRIHKKSTEEGKKEQGEKVGGRIATGSSDAGAGWTCPCPDGYENGSRN